VHPRCAIRKSKRISPKDGTGSSATQSKIKVLTMQFYGPHEVAGPRSSLDFFDDRTSAADWVEAAVSPYEREIPRQASLEVTPTRVFVEAKDRNAPDRRRETREAPV